MTEGGEGEEDLIRGGSDSFATAFEPDTFLVASHAEAAAADPLG